MSGFTLLPLRQITLRGELPKWDAATLALLVALVAHADEAGECFPSQDRLAILSGLSRSTVRDQTALLARAGWLKTWHATATLRYKLLCQRYDAQKNNANLFIRMGQSVVFRGVWAAMSPSCKVMYLALLSYARMPEYFWSDKAYENDDDPGFSVISLTDFDVSKIDAAAGCEPRTGRKARQWLMENKLLVFDEEDEGFIMPIDPQMESRAVLERLERAKERRPSPGAKRSATNAKKYNVDTRHNDDVLAEQIVSGSGTKNCE